MIRCAIIGAVVFAVVSFALGSNVVLAYAFVGSFVGVIVGALVVILDDERRDQRCR